MRADWKIPDAMDDTLARLLPLVPVLGGCDFSSCGVDTIIDGLRRERQTRADLAQQLTIVTADAPGAP